MTLQTLARFGLLALLSGGALAFFGLVPFSLVTPVVMGAVLAIAILDKFCAALAGQGFLEWPR